MKNNILFVGLEILFICCIQEFQEAVINTISQLCVELGEEEEEEITVRILAKFLESDKERVDRCSELFVRYFKQVSFVERRIDETIQHIKLDGDEDELADLEDEDNVYAEVSFHIIY